MQPMIIYHAHCSDGFGAAWAAWRHFNREAELVPATYGKAPPDVTGRNVYILDFSYKSDVLMEMCIKASYITLLDHHKTAYENLSAEFGDYEFSKTTPEMFEFYDDIPDASNIHVKVDMQHSGAMLAWQYFFGDLPPPELLLHIEDRDLWKFAMPNTRPILSALTSYDQEINTWDELMSADLVEMCHEGKAIERKYQKDVKAIVAMSQRTGWIGGYNVPMANCPAQFASDVGSTMAVGHSFAATYYDTEDGRKFSLRSLKEGGLDVAKIAQEFGGGGHKSAAGFSVPREHELAQL